MKPTTSNSRGDANTGASSALRPVTWLVSTLSMAVHDGQLVARPRLLPAPSAS